MVSEEVRARTRLSACLREVDRVRVQGKDEAVTLFCWDEVYVETRKTSHRLAYEKALHLYRNGAFEEALPLLLEGEHEGDLLCQCLAERITKMPAIAANWDGIWNVDKIEY